MSNSIIQGQASVSDSSFAFCSPIDRLTGPPPVDLSWVANSSRKYTAALKLLPTVFAWVESPGFFASILVLKQSVADQRLKSCFEFIGRSDPSLCASMEALFQKLPPSGKHRFVTAPETFWRITNMRREPVDSIIRLCTLLNGEAAMVGLGPALPGYVSALGDFFVVSQEKLEPALNAVFNAETEAWMVRTPVVGGNIPVDFSSPIMKSAQETNVAKTYGQYSVEQQANICTQLTRTIDQIERVSNIAATLIRSFVKVIVPLNSDVGHGSTSQPRIPGRVLLSGIERSSDASLASALVHEAMHQLMYILEWKGPFISPDEDAVEARAKSLWTGRELPLHSFLHACFIWYGVSNFWLEAERQAVFDSDRIARELKRSAAGFMERNPIEELAPHAPKVRYDVYKTASTLQLRIRERLRQSPSQAMSQSPSPLSH